MPLISVCIPAYKRTDYLRRLLNSLKGQTFTDFDVVLTDDSPDQSVRQLVAEYPQLNIRYLRNEPRAGTPENWNRALLAAEGAWIKIMHDDDWFAKPDSLQLFAEAAKKGTGSFVFSASCYVHENGGSHTRVLTEEEERLLRQDPVGLVADNLIGHPSAVLHRKDDAVLYDPAYKWVVDMDFYIRYLRKHPSFTYIREPLVNIGVGSSQVSQDCYKNPAVEIPEYLALLSGYGPELPLRNVHVFECLWTLVRKFRLKSAEEVRQYGYKGAIPPVLDPIISAQRKVPRLVLKQTPWSRYFMRKNFARLSGEGLKRGA